MKKKILVINGHGAKRSQKMHINSKHGIMTPGNADNSYVVSFDNQTRHLEEMTSKGNIWPIVDGKGNSLQWHKYEETDVHDISITPLQAEFNTSKFAHAILNKKTGWENISNPAHDVQARGALAVRELNGGIKIYEGAQLTQYLQQMANKTNQSTPLFFCDKEIGKIKPLGNTSLSEIYAGVALIGELQAFGTEIIVATCSPTNNTYESVQVQTEQPATAMEHTPIVKMTSVRPPFVLKDPSGDNYVDSVEPITNGGYLIKGRNNQGELRSITIDQHGNATGFKGAKDLGVVGRAMDANRAEISVHFHISLPVKPIVATPTPIVNGQEKCKGTAFTEKFRNLTGKQLTSTQFLPFEKYKKDHKEARMTQLIDAIANSSDPAFIGIKLGDLFREACTTRNMFSSEQYSLDTHSAAELRTKLMQSDKIMSSLGLDKVANKDSALRSLMKQAIDGQDIKISEKAEKNIDSPAQAPKF